MISGGIIIWSGAVVNIPSGYVLCDGNNGTPDLTDKFIVGAGDTYAVGANGGNINHSHANTDTGHTHPTTNVESYDIQAPVAAYTDSGAADLDNANADGRPPYYALCYIMKT